MFLGARSPATYSPEKRSHRGRVLALGRADAMGQEDGNRGERRAAGTPVEVTALYATDGCVITSSIALLTNSLLGAEPVYIFSYDAYTHDGRADGPTEQDRFEESRALYQASGGLNGDSFRVTFCLLGTEVGGTHQARGRTRPMFVCRFERADDVAALQDALAHGTPLQPDHIAATLDAEATFALHANMILALTVAINNASPRTGRDAPRRSMIRARPYARSWGARPWDNAALPRYTSTTRCACLPRTAGRIMEARRVPSGFLANSGRTKKPGAHHSVLPASGPASGGAGATYDLQAIKDICATYAIPHAPAPTPSALRP